MERIRQSNSGRTVSVSIERSTGSSDGLPTPGHPQRRLWQRRRVKQLARACFALNLLTTTFLAVITTIVVRAAMSADVVTAAGSSSNASSSSSVNGSSANTTTFNCTVDENNFLQPQRLCPEGGTDVLGVTCENNNGCNIHHPVNPWRPRDFIMEAMEDRLSWFISEELKVRQHDMLFSAPIDVTELLGPNYVAGPATLYSSLLDATAGVPLGLPSAQAALQSIPVSLGLVGSTLRINTSHSRGSARVPIGGYVDGNASIAITVPFFGRLDADVALTARLGVEATVQLIASFEDVEILSFGGLTFGAHVRSINLTVGAVLDYESLDISHALITVTDGSALIGAAANALIDVVTIASDRFRWLWSASDCFELLRIASDCF